MLTRLALKTAGNTFNQVRLVSGVRAEMPKLLNENLTNYFQKNSENLPPTGSVIKKGSKLLMESLQNFHGQDSVEAETFLNALEEFKRTGNKFLILENGPTKPEVLKLFTNLLAGIIDDRLNKSSDTRITERGKLKTAGPHTDGARFFGGINVVVTMLSGVSSNGDGVTALYDLEKITAKLSASSKAILAQPIFGYEDPSSVADINNYSRFCAPILYRDNREVWKANFSYDLRKGLLYDSDKITASNREIENAIEEIYASVAEAMTKKDCLELRIKSGTSVILKNAELLHEKWPGFTDLRDVYFVSYVPEEEKITTKTFVVGGGANGKDERRK